METIFICDTCFVFDGVLFIEKGNSYFLYTIPINTLEMLVAFLITAGLIIKITPIGKYHAAEHKVAHAYMKDPRLTLEMVKTQSRIHNDCGTNLVISVVICFFLLYTVFGDTAWVLLVSWSMGFELWKSEPKIIWDSVLVIGKVAQYLLFTSTPQEKHLIVAIDAITKLEEKELANDS